MDNLMETVREYLVCLSWEEAHRLVCAHPKLLSAQAISMLALLSAGHPDIQEAIFLPHSDLLVRCRDVGVEQAFAEKLAPLQVVSPRLMEEFRKALMADDKAALVELVRDHPELRPAWKTGPLERRRVVPPPEYAAETAQIYRLQEQDHDSDHRDQLVAAFEALCAWTASPPPSLTSFMEAPWSARCPAPSNFRLACQRAATAMSRSDRSPRNR